MISRTHAILLASFALAFALPSASTTAEDRRPNLVIIQTDEHNFRTLGCYRELLPPDQAFPWGKEAYVETPHIDSLARSGALCTSFYATTPVCSPSRAAFVSGRYPHNTPVNTNNIPLDDSVVTFAELLRRQGYATGYAGKWHLDGTGKPQWAPKRKFGFEDNRFLFNRGHWKQLEIGPEGPRIKARNASGKPTYDVGGADEKSFTTDFLADRTVEFIAAHEKKPFCYLVSIPDPHGPDTVRPPYDTMFQGQESQAPRTFHKPDADLPSWAKKAGGYNGMARYHGMVKCIDDNVGKILDVLRSRGLVDRTIVVFTADHGDLRGEHHRQNKGVPFEGSARIPFVIRYPGKIRPGTVIGEALSCVDFLPTICGLTGIPTTGEEEGRDASALFLKGKAPEGWEDIAFLRGTGVEEGWLAAVTDRYKLIYSTRDAPWLFDLEEDPDELRNFFGDPACKETVRALSRELHEYGRKYKDPRAANARIRADLEKALRGADSRGSWKLRATGHDSRIDLHWECPIETHRCEYDVHRSPDGREPFVKLTRKSHRTHLYSDFTGENDRTYFYRVSCNGVDNREITPSPVVSARSRAMGDDELLTSVQEATFRYFWDHGHPVSGLARERYSSGDTCTTGGTGFGLMAIMVGAERGFVTREEAAARILEMLTFLEGEAARYHGAWSHWLNGATGKTIPFARKNGVRADDGGDIVETSFLIQGMLTIRQYFGRDDAVEKAIRERVTRMWQEVEWNWYLRRPGGKRLYWHWSPNHGWMMDHAIGGHFNECMITYLLALASPTHRVPASCYREGWVGDPEEYANGNEYYGHKLWVGWPMGGRLFFTHYSFLGFDPRGRRDRFCNYFENSRNIALMHRAYCTENPKGHKGYGPLVWGLTSCDTPDGYRGLDPHTRDNGTIAPTAAISSMPYTPDISLATLKHYYHEYGDRLWGEFGFRDAFNLERDWFARSYLAIDQGPIICMIENHRTGLCWKMFMSNPEIEPMLERIGWKFTGGS